MWRKIEARGSCAKLPRSVSTEEKRQTLPMTFLKTVFNRSIDERENAGGASRATHPAPLGRTEEPRKCKSRAHETYSYLDCVGGKAPVPHDLLGKSMFSLLMAGGMTTFMVTFNGVLHSSANVLGFIIQSHWMFPLVVCISLSMRFLFADRLVGWLAPRFILPHLHGFARNAAMTLLNVALMAPVMGCIMTLLLNGPQGFIAHLAGTLPLSAVVAVLVNLLVVGPVVKMLYHNVLTPKAGARMLHVTQRYATNWAGVFTA